MTRSGHIVRCVGVHKRFSFDRKEGAALHVLKGVDLEVKEHEMVGIIGASGAGKSTLLHILGGLDRPSEGRVFWDGDDISKLSDEELAKRRVRTIGFVFQFHHLLPEFSALENVALPAMIGGLKRDVAEARAHKLLKEVGLEDRIEHKPAELSGGEQQRVAVARALVNSPRVVLADEPSGNLDSLHSRQLQDLLGELNRTHGHAFVIVTHNEAWARETDRTFRIVDGVLHLVH